MTARPIDATNGKASPPPQNASGSPVQLRVITFNCAVGNSAITTPQALFTQLPFYREVIEGRPTAPLMALQEVGIEQLDELKRLEHKGQFRLQYVKTAGGLRKEQFNAVLVPKRFELREVVEHAYEGTWPKGVLGSLRDSMNNGYAPNYGQWFEKRRLSELRLFDTVAQKPFTLFNTHLSNEGAFRKAQAQALVELGRQARARGPVIIVGDLNVASAETDQHADRGTDAQVRAMFAADGFVNVGAKGRPRADGPPVMGPGAPNDGTRDNIDVVAVNGFAPVSSRWHTGADVSLPGHPTAETISDHYAEDDVIAWQ